MFVRGLQNIQYANLVGLYCMNFQMYGHNAANLIHPILSTTVLSDVPERIASAASLSNAISSSVFT